MMSFRLLQSLLQRSFKIQQRIEDEQKRKVPDNLRLLKLKKIRLIIADRLRQLLTVPSGPGQLSPVPVRRARKSYR
jgi:hypothetical protein